jgi:hypothetical protein
MGLFTTKPRLTVEDIFTCARNAHISQFPELDVEGDKDPTCKGSVSNARLMWPNGVIYLFMWHIHVVADPSRFLNHMAVVHTLQSGEIIYHSHITHNELVRINPTFYATNLSVNLYQSPDELRLDCHDENGQRVQTIIPVKPRLCDWLGLNAFGLFD